MQCNERKRQAGFSLIELLVVIAIVGIMTVLLLATVQQSRDDRMVDAAARQVVAAVRAAQGYAVAGRYDGVLPCSFTFFAQGHTYGIRSTYRDRNRRCSGTRVLATYATSRNVTLDAVAITFTVPHGSLASGLTAEKVIVLRAGNVQRRICISGVGRIRERC